MRTPTIIALDLFVTRMDLGQQQALESFYGEMVIDDPEMHYDAMENAASADPLQTKYDELLSEYSALGLSDAGDKELDRYCAWWNGGELETVDDMFAFSKYQEWDKEPSM